MGRKVNNEYVDVSICTFFRSIQDVCQRSILVLNNENNALVCFIHLKWDRFETKIILLPTPIPRLPPISQLHSPHYNRGEAHHRLQPPMNRASTSIQMRTRASLVVLSTALFSGLLPSQCAKLPNWRGPDTFFEGTLPSARNIHRFASCDGIIYLLGGQDSKGEMLRASRRRHYVNVFDLVASH